jgi:hypothetical protein
MIGSADGSSGMAAALRAHGYDAVHFGSYGDLAPAGFRRLEDGEDDRITIERTIRWLADDGRSSRHMLFMHLRGGHAAATALEPLSRAAYDRQVAGSLDALPKLLSAIPPETVVVLGGDHGEAFNEHGSSFHATSVYDEEIRTPMLLRIPGISGGRRPSAVGCREVREIVADAVSGRVPMPARNVVQVAALNIASTAHFAGWQLRTRAMIVGRWKAIWNVDVNLWELYDLESDAGEQTDLAATRPEVVGAFAEGFRLATAAGWFDEES